MRDKYNKVCPICGIKFPRTKEFFHSDKCSSDGLKTRCKKCLNASQRKGRVVDLLNRTCSKCKKTYPRTTEYFYKNNQAWDGLTCKCKECIKKEPHNWAKNNPEKAKVTRQRANLKYRTGKREQRLENARKRNKIRYKTEPAYRMRMVLSQRLYNSLKGRIKEETTMLLLGCSINDFVLWIEDKFQDGMSWDNHGNAINQWNLDHIKPCASFNLENIEEQRKCFHYTNYQPMWSKPNRVKSSVFDGYFYSHGEPIRAIA